MEFVRKEEKVSEAVPLQKAVVEEARMAAKNQSPLSNAENAVEMRLRFRHGENLPLSKVSGVRALPSRITCGSSTNLHILLKERIPSVDGVELEFTQPPQPSTFIAAQTVNPYTVCCKAPDMPPGSVEVTIRCNGVELARACLKYCTQMEELCDLLRTSCEPVSFMCQAYNIIPYDANRLDALLAESLCNNSTHQVLHLFAPGPVCAEEKLRREELPTLLHFAARYGFCKLATELLHLPGAFQAYSALNCHGFYPNNLASANGFQDFRHFLDNTVNEISDICTSETMKHESCLKYQENNPENVYEDMKAFLPTIRPSSRVKHSVNMQHSQRCGQEWLIWLQEQVKAGDLSIDEARLLFGEWKLNQQQRCTSLRLHEETLTRIRDSIARRQQQQKEYGACKGAWCISDPEKYNLMNRVPHCAQSLQKDMKKRSTSAVSDFDDWYSSVSNSNNSRETNTECNECVWDFESAPQFHLPSHQSSLESTKLASSREATQPHDNEPKTSSTLQDQSSLLQPISFISPKFTALSKLSSENCPALPIPKPRKSLEHLPPAKKL